MAEKITPREQTIFDMLLKGIQPKEIAHNLSLKYNTVITCQKKLYRKLSVNNINELLVKYLSSNVQVDSSKAETKEEFPAVFYDWSYFRDTEESNMEIIRNPSDKIDDNVFISYSFSGSKTNYGHVCTDGKPSPDTLVAMKKMTSFSFKALGDGNDYAVMLPTTDTHNDDHFSKTFSTVKDKIITITVKIDDLKQQGWGNSLQFIQNNIFLIQFQPLVPGSFNLKIWDFRLY